MNGGLVHAPLGMHLTFHILEMVYLMISIEMLHLSTGQSFYFLLETSTKWIKEISKSI